MKKILLLIKRLSCLIIFISLYPTLTSAQSGEWRTYNSYNTGLPTWAVEEIAFDQSGNMWVATKWALVKYDGASWTVFDTVQVNDMPVSILSNVAVDNNGYIWSSTPFGLTGGFKPGIQVFDGSSWTLFDEEDPGLETYGISEIIVDDDNNIWASTYRGFAKYDGSQWHTYRPTDSQGNPYNISLKAMTMDNQGNVVAQQVYGQMWRCSPNGTLEKLDVNPYDVEGSEMMYDASGDLWLASQSGLVKYDGTDFILYNQSNTDIPTNSVRSVTVNGNSVFIGTSSQGFGSFDNATHFEIDNSYYDLMEANITPYSIDYLSASNIWLSTNLGLLHFDGSSWEIFTVYNTGVSENDVSSVFYKDGSVWLTGWNNGFAEMYAPNSFNTYTWIEGITARGTGMYDIFVDSGNKVWVSTTSGLVTNNSGSWETFDFAQYESYSSVCEDNYGNIWTSTQYDGVYMYNGNDWTHYNSSDGLYNNYTHVIKNGPDGKIWVGTNSGLNYYESGNWAGYNTNDGLSGSTIMDIDFYNNVIAVGTNGGGISIWNGSSWDGYTTANSDIAGDYVTAVKYDPNGVLWIGTQNSGICRFHNGNWTTYNKDNSPIGTNYIKDIDIDSGNNKLIGTSYFNSRTGGLVIYNENQITGLQDIEEYPSDFRLSQNYPNPFNPSTTIRFSIPEASNVSLKVFNLLGQEIKTLVNGQLSAGSYNVNFDGDDLSSGIYFYRIVAENFSATKKLMLVK